MDPDEIIEDQQPQRLDKKLYAKTATQNLISRSSSFIGLQNIFMQGKCVLREQSVVRADLARVRIFLSFFFVFPFLSLCCR